MHEYGTVIELKFFIMRYAKGLEKSKITKMSSAR